MAELFEINVVDSLDELPSFTLKDPVFMDIETDGLYTNTRLIQLYQPNQGNIVYIIDTDKIDEQGAKDFIKPLWTVWQGCSYDFGTLNMTTEKFDDTLYLARIAYPQWGEFTLDNIVKKLGHSHLYEGIDKKDMQKKGFIKGAYLSRKQLLYSALDVYALSLIWEDETFQKARNTKAYMLDIFNVRYAIEYQQNGLISDQQAVREELDKIEDIIDANYNALGGLNPNSPKQVKEALGTEGSSKEILIDLITKGNHTAKLVYEQRRLLKRRTMLNSYNFPKVVTRFNVNGAVTGRFTSTGGDLQRGINAQQIPRDLQYIFNKDTNDTVVIHADFSTAELRAGCSIMKDAQMYDELKRGLDLHKISANMATGTPVDQVTKAERQKGKAVSFGLSNIAQVKDIELLGSLSA